ncbi:MAG: cytochrome o ubiquinol oxidase subunit IV [Cardiobacteriaceae bacterium]|nr:cytochrome o ubiquinol oxidase subunit IV [Cardiobacteriaceae bacterium]
MTAHGNKRQYITGLILSLVLTAIPFTCVLSGGLSATTLAVIVLLSCIAQILVQMVLFLHMSLSPRQGWQSFSAFYLLIILLIIVVLTIWIFEHLNHNMLMGH